MDGKVADHDYFTPATVMSQYLRQNARVPSESTPVAQASDIPAPLQVEALGSGYANAQTTQKWQSSASSVNSQSAKDNTKRVWSPFEQTRIVTPKKEGGVQTTYQVELVSDPEHAFVYGRSTHLLLEFSYPIQDSSSAKSETSAASLALMNACATSLHATFKAMFTIMDLPEAKYVFRQGTELHPSFYQIISLGSAEQTEPTSVEALRRLTSGRVSLWFLTNKSITPAGFKADPSNNFSFSLTRSQLLATFNSLVKVFGLRCANVTTSPAAENPVLKELITAQTKKGFHPLVSFPGNPSESMPAFSIALVFQFKEGAAGFGKDWELKRAEMAKMRVNIEQKILSCGLPVLDIPSTVESAIEAQHGNFQIHLSHCTMDELNLLHTLPLYTPGTKVLNPARPRHSVAKLATSASIQMFFASVLPLLVSPWTDSAQTSS